MYLSLMNDKEIRKEWEILTASDVVRVCVRVKWIDGICLPDSGGTEKVWATFRRLTCGDYWEIEEKALISVGEGRAETRYIDNETTKRMMVERLLVDWSLDIPLQIDEETGCLTKDSFERAMSISAPLMSALLTEYEKSNEISEEEQKKADRQGAILFSKDSKGVSNACETVSLFCTLGNFWEKFGLNRFDLRSLPYREFVMLRMMMQKEGEAMKAQTRSRPSGASKIAGPGGRVRPSRGVVVGQ